ncbi:MAG: hypothetical protein Q8N65_01340 [bacterium]|nr:hypothetical protein [bacterium]
MKQFSNRGSFLLIIALVLLVISGILVISSRFNNQEAAKSPNASSSSTPSSSSAFSPTPTPTPSSTVTPQNTVKAWDIFQEYLAGIKAHDLDRMNKIVYEKIDPNVYCKDMGLGKDACLSMIWSVVDVMSKDAEKQKEGDFINVSEDKNQIIMATNIFPDGDKRYTKNHIYFVKSLEGNTLVLGYGTSSWGFSGDELIAATKDSDGDDLPDRDEKCVYGDKEQYNKPYCTKTNPNSKDTDGDGWWDSIEESAKTNPNSSQSHPF